MREKWTELSSMLVDLTEERKLDWQETPDENVFMAKLGRFLIQVEEISRSATRDDYVVKIYGKDGKLADEFSDSDIQNANNYSWEDRFRFMFKSIRRQISGAEEILDGVLAELRKKTNEIPF